MSISLSQILLQPRQTTSDWLIVQSKHLSDLGKLQSAHSLLIYGALEARNAIEQIYFEILKLVHDGEMTIEFYEKCRKSRSGYLEAIAKAEPKYRKIFMFSSAVLEVENAPFKGIIWNIKTLKNFWNALSDYCHTQGSVEQTLNSQEWVETGYKLIDETYIYFEKNMKGGATALLKPSKMTPEGREIWERFDRDEIDENGVKDELRKSGKSK